MSRPRDRSPRRLPAIAGALLLLGLAPAQAARLPEPGTPLEIRGTVSTSDGKPIAGLEVRLVGEASRYDWHRLTRGTSAPIHLATATDERGEFRLAWVLAAGYASFRVEASQLYRRDRADARQDLATIDITPRLLAGSPIVVALTVSDVSFLDDLRRFLASLTSEAERGAYQELGRPDRIDRVEAGSPTPASPSAESTWWYFNLGTALRWADGRLVETTKFDPIRPF